MTEAQLVVDQSHPRRSQLPEFTSGQRPNQFGWRRPLLLQPVRDKWKLGRINPRHHMDIWLGHSTADHPHLHAGDLPPFLPVCIHAYRCPCTTLESLDMQAGVAGQKKAIQILIVREQHRCDPRPQGFSFRRQCQRRVQTKKGIDAGS